MMGVSRNMAELALEGLRAACSSPSETATKKKKQTNTCSEESFTHECSSSSGVACEELGEVAAASLKKLHAN